MKNSILALTFLLVLAQLHASVNSQPVNKSVLDELVALERAALDKWIRRDPQGYLDLYASDITYFDPFQKTRIDGIGAIKAMLAGIMAAAPPPVASPRYELIGARAQHHGDVAILTFQVINYGTLPGKGESVLARWNSTETYRRDGGRWRIIHSHWSFVKPELKQSITEDS